MDSAPGPTGSAYRPWAKQQQCEEAQSSGQQPGKSPPQQERGETVPLARCCCRKGERACWYAFSRSIIEGMFQKQCNRESSRRLHSPRAGRKGISTAFSKALAIPILRQVKQLGDAKQICSQSIWLNSVCLPLLSLALHQTHTSDVSAFAPCL